MLKSWVELLFANRSDFTAVASSNAEASLLGGNNLQPALAFPFYDSQSFGKTIRIRGKGVFSTTGTPTMIFQFRLSPTVGSGTLSGASVGVSAAITTQSSVTNKYFEFSLDLVCNTPGFGSTNTTLSGGGKVESPGGFASPFVYALEPTTPDTGTWTSTVDGSLTQYLNVSLTWSASSSSNTCTLKQLTVERLN